MREGRKDMIACDNTRAISRTALEFRKKPAPPGPALDIHSPSVAQHPNSLLAVVT